MTERAAYWLPDAPWPIFKRKTADEGVLNSAVLQDDDHLVGLSLAVGWWRLYALLKTQFYVASDFQRRFDFSGTVTSNLPGMWQWGEVAGTHRSGGWEALINTTRVQTVPNYGVTGWLREEGLFRVTVAGILKLQWAQATAIAETTRLFIGSLLMLTKVG